MDGRPWLPHRPFCFVHFVYMCAKCTEQDPHFSVKALLKALAGLLFFPMIAVTTFLPFWASYRGLPAEACWILFMVLMVINVKLGVWGEVKF